MEIVLLLMVIHQKMVLVNKKAKLSFFLPLCYNGYGENMKKYADKINLLLNCFVIVYVPLFMTIYSIFPKYKLLAPMPVQDLLYLIIPIELIIYFYNLIKRNNRIDKYDIFIYILVFLGIITSIFAVDRFTSVWGSYSRNSGLLALISFYLLFLNSKSMNTKQVNQVTNLLFIVGIFQFVYSLLQVFVRGEAVFTFSLNNVNYMAMGFAGNPNFLGSYCIMLLGLSLMFYFIYDKKRYFWLSVMFYVNLILAQSTGPFFALICLFIFIIIFLLIKKIVDWKKIIIVFLTFVITFIFVSNFVEIYCKKVFNDEIISSYTIKGDILSTFNILKSNKSGDETKELENYGSGRIKIWKNTLKVVPKYIWLGAGIDNLGRVYPAEHNQGGVVDKAHNEYLEMLVTQGIFALITYLLFLINLFVDGMKSKSKLSWIFMIGFIGYAMQAFLNISVIGVAPVFYIIMGMFVSTLKKA